MAESLFFLPLFSYRTQSPPVLDRPVSLLADHVRKATSAFFTIQENMTLNKKVPKSFLTQVMDGKHVFRAHCEAIRRVLQSSCRHAVDYATSSQRPPDDRFMSAKRCFLSAKSVYRDVLELSRAYEVTVVDFNKQRSLLSAYLTAHAKNGEVFDFFFSDSVTLLKQKNFSSQVAGRERE